uniref:C2H2-type domain-containing protein n=1 Tax=Chaetoceros debilis TaxID=122233 RepID=A0A7S3Q0E7_9STRA
MPHCQKENHNRGALSKAERLKKKEAALAKKNAKAARELEEELEKQKLLGNNIAMAEGHGEYILGCEEEKEYVVKVNLNKRSKKHLRFDIRRQQQKKEEEEEERLKREREEKYRLEQAAKKKEENEEDDDDDEEEEDEEEPLTTEHLVYICLCCDKKFKTTNQFENHTNSRRHKQNAKLFEEAGVIVTDIKLVRGGGDMEKFEAEDEDEDGFGYELHQELQDGEDGLPLEDMEEKAESEKEEYEEEPKRVGNLFSAFGEFSDSSSSSSSSSDDDNDSHEESEAEEDENNIESTIPTEEVDDNEDVYDDDLDLLEEIIYQNRLQDRFYPDEEEEEKATEISTVSVPFDDDQYDPDNFNENRLAAVQYRLQKRLAEKGIKPNNINPGYKNSDAVSIGKTLLQQVMEANIETLEERLAEYRKHKAECQLLGREFRFAKGNSKALASQYTYRIDPSDNARRRENTHHTGSHYHMQAARSMQFGRTKGMMARHSSQGARLQASRMASKEMARMQGKGSKIGQTSKKSQQKRRGEAGGSKKSGGATTSEK